MVELDDVVDSLGVHPIPWKLIKSEDTIHAVEIIDAEGDTVIYGHAEDCILVYSRIVKAVNIYKEPKPCYECNGTGFIARDKLIGYTICCNCERGKQLYNKNNPNKPQR